jgi:hypothetical protein
MNNQWNLSSVRDSRRRGNDSSWCCRVPADHCILSDNDKIARRNVRPGSGEHDPGGGDVLVAG